MDQHWVTKNELRCKSTELWDQIGLDWAQFSPYYVHLNKSHDFSWTNFPNCLFKTRNKLLALFFVQDLLEAIIDMINTLQAIKWDINIEIVTVFDHFYCSCYYCPLAPKVHHKKHMVNSPYRWIHIIQYTVWRNNRYQ